MLVLERKTLAWSRFRSLDDAVRKDFLQKIKDNGLKLYGSNITEIYPWEIQEVFEWDNGLVLTYSLGSSNNVSLIGVDKIIKKGFNQDNLFFHLSKTKSGSYLRYDYSKKI